MASNQKMYIAMRYAVRLGMAYLVIEWAIIATICAYLYKNEQCTNYYFLLLPAMGLMVFKFKNKRVVKPARIPKYAHIFNDKIKKYYSSDYADRQRKVYEYYVELSKDINFALHSKKSYRQKA